jgi:cystathionine beta-synthase
MGTGGTISGAGKYLKEQNPDLKIWAADPFGSILKEYKETGKLTQGHPYLVEGIGEDMVPGILDIDLIDEIVNISDEDSFYVSRQMARKEGILGGGSTGTNMKLALEVAASMRPDQVVVTIIPDTGDRYLSKHFSDQWLNEKGMLSRDTVSLYRLNRLKNDDLISIISASPDESVRSALEHMTNSNVSQLPVLDGDRNLGSVRESALLALALKDQTKLDQLVQDVMEKPFPTQDETATVAQSKQLLLENQGIVTTRNNKIVGFITRHDIINFSDK